MEIRNVIDEEHNNRPNVKIRFRKTLDWLSRFDGQFDGKFGLDVGDIFS